MHPADRFQERVAEAFASMILTLVAAIASAVLSTSSQTVPPNATMGTETTIQILIGFIQSLPGLVAAVSVIGATVVAGPLGFIGALLEIAGASQLLHQPSQSGFWLICLGAAMVVVGRFVPWGTVASLLFESRSSGYHR